jgi:hypothetical protein
VVGIIVDLPFCSRPVCLPVLARLWRPGSGVSKVELAAQLLTLLSVAHAGRRIDAVADAARHGPALRDMPPTRTFTTRLPARSNTHGPQPASITQRENPTPRNQRKSRASDAGKNFGSRCRFRARAIVVAVEIRYGAGSRDEESLMKQYLMSVHMVEGQQPPAPEAMQQMYADVEAFNNQLKEAGAWVFAGGLHAPESATVVRIQDGQALTTDGPFAETKEHLGGFWVIKAEDLDAALAWATGAAQACQGPVEVRPFQDEPGQ